MVEAVRRVPGLVRQRGPDRLMDCLSPHCAVATRPWMQARFDSAQRGGARVGMGAPKSPRFRLGPPPPPRRALMPHLPACWWASPSPRALSPWALQ